MSPDSTAQPATRQAAARWSSATLLLGGGVLIFMTFMRYSLAELGWVAFAPFAVFIYRDGSVKRHLALYATLAVAFTAAVAKIATSEIPWAPVPMFSIPIATIYFVALAVSGAAYRRLGPRFAVYAFAATAVALGWIQYSFTPGASWGILAHTQADNLPLVQLASLTGVGGISFLVAMGSGLAATIWLGGARRMRYDIAVFTLLLASALVYGQLRLGATSPGRPVRVAGIVSPVTHEDFWKAAADVDSVRPLDDELFARSERAADRGATIVVWNEVSSLTTVAGEAALASRAQAFAKRRNVLLVMAYAVVTSTQPLFYVNKYRIYLPDGNLADEYVKRHPVPGDPHDAGTAHARVIPYAGVKVSGAICYDYSFPHIARDNARDGADIALLPASDWRGIDPLHGRMAIMDAVAAGLPMVRPVRASTSVASDQFGRVLGSMRFDGVNDGVLVVDVPGKRVPTLYTAIGEAVPVAAVVFVGFVVIQLAVRRRPAAAV